MFSTSIPAKQIVYQLKEPQSSVPAAAFPAYKLWSSLKDVCDLLRIAATPSIEQETLQFQHVRYRRGQRIYTMGQPFKALYVVRDGALKTVVVDDAGQEQILSFPMRGDMIGIDGIFPRLYSSEAIALSDCELVYLPFKQFAALGKSHLGLDSAIYSVMSEDLLREQSVIRMLGAIGAEARVAQFLAWMSKRFDEIGQGGAAFSLPMSRIEIGSYLGLSLETVSRAFSHFKKAGFISVDRRTIDIHDWQALAGLRHAAPAGSQKQRDARKRSA